MAGQPGVVGIVASGVTAAVGSVRAVGVGSALGAIATAWVRGSPIQPQGFTTTSPMRTAASPIASAGRMGDRRGIVTGRTS